MFDMLLKIYLCIWFSLSQGLSGVVGVNPALLDEEDSFDDIECVLWRESSYPVQKIK